MKEWDFVIKPSKRWLDFDFNEIFRNRDLIYLFIKRDFVVFYKQTILGPLWYIIQPLVNTVIFTIIFSNLAKISTDGMPPFLFYLSGTITWGYFASCLNAISNTFIKNAGLFGKVYFPRLSIPIADTIFSLVQFAIQFLIFIGFYIYFIFHGFEAKINYLIVLFPILLLQMALLGLGFGILISSLTTKYRDLTFAMSFGVQIWMYITPVVYPLSLIPDDYKLFVLLNPMTSVVELFKSIFFNTNSISIFDFTVSFIVTLIIFCLGFFRFVKTERNFIDTV